VSGIEVDFGADGTITGVRGMSRDGQFFNRPVNPPVRVEAGKTYLVDYKTGTIREKGQPNPAPSTFFTGPPDEPRDAERYMQRHIHAWITVALLAEETWLRTQIRRLDPGDRLCVHARQTVLDHDHDGWTNTFTTSAHRLPPRFVCSSQGERTEYGPMPACRQPACGLRYGHSGPCADGVV
jgi:hypothetical protein